MGERIFELLRAHFAQHGYWTVAGALLLENAGVPVPGETILLFASFLASSEHELKLPWIIVVATLACTFGDNLGYIIGHHGGRPLLERYKHLFRISQAHIDRAEKLFARHGPPTVFVARFIFGMRILAGPLAGVLRMPWKAFLLFNFLGAVLWVSVISSIGYLFGRNWSKLLRIVRNVNVGVLILVGVVVLVLWLLHRRKETAVRRISAAEKPDKDRCCTTREGQS
ncbi:MAG: DedA family protein [Terriglobales bacterium]